MSQPYPQTRVPSSPGPLRIEAAGATDAGRVRPDNEDAFAIRLDLGLFLISDGMGGHAAGEVAARMAIDTVCESLQDAGATSTEAGRTPLGPGLPSLVEAIRHANTRIFAAAQRDPAKRDMGTTIAAALAYAGRVAIAHVGDSRIYRLRERRLDLLTEDHSLVNDLIREGTLDPANAASFVFRSQITRALGPKEAVEVDARLLEPSPGDVLLLCSDGLSDVIADWEMAGILVEHHELERAAAALVSRANDAGGPDNVTCVLLRWSEAGSGHGRP